MNNQTSSSSLFSIPLSFFFFNKPRTFKVYISCVLMIACLTAIVDGFGMVVSFPISWFTFSLIYKAYLYFDYFIKDQDLNIKNIKISCVKPYFRNYFKTIAWMLFFCLLLICFCPIYVEDEKIVEKTAALALRVTSQYNFLFLVLTILSSVILEKMIVLKFISEGIKNNADIATTNIESIYGELREILTKKLIDVKPTQDL